MYYGIVYDFTSLPNRFDVCKNYIPELDQYKEWSEQVLDAGKEVLKNYFDDVYKESKKKK